MSTAGQLCLLLLFKFACLRGFQRSKALLVVGSNPGSTGAAWVTGGQLVATNAGVTIGTQGAGSLTQSGGVVRTEIEFVGLNPGGQGALTAAGGVHVVDDGGLLIACVTGSTGTVWITGAQLVTTNSNTIVGTQGVGRRTVSNGSWQARWVSSALSWSMAAN